MTNLNRAQLALLILAATACGTSDPTPSPRPPLAAKASSPPPKAVKVDASAVYACRNFGRVLEDAKAGIITDAELRLRLQTIYEEDARLIDTSVAPGVKEGVEQVLRITTQRQGNFLKAVNELIAACNQPGAQQPQ